MVEEVKEAKDWLCGNELGYTIWNNKYRLNNESFQEWLNRISNGNQDVIDLVLKKRFIFGGRTLANRGKKDGSYSNCYSIGYVPDSLEGIMDVNSKIAMTFKAQGGQGLSLSHIRPKGSPIKGLYESDGIVPFMEMFNTTTSSISQGGCIHEDEWVDTKNGLKHIKDIKIGDFVWTKKGYIKVNYVWDRGIKDTYQVLTSSGNIIRTTLDHKFCVDGFNTKPLKDLNIGDNINIIKGITCSPDSFNEYYYLWGALLANGYINKYRNAGNIAFNNNVNLGRTAIYNWIKKQGLKVKIGEYENYYRLYLTKEAIKKLKLDKPKACNIDIPDFIMKSDYNKRLSFIAGLLDTDGCVYNNYFKYDSISKQFIYSLRILLNSVGFFSTTNTKYREGRKPLYTINCSIYENRNIFCDKWKNVSGIRNNSRKSTPYAIENLNIINRTGHLKKISKKNKIGLYTYLQECTQYTPMIEDAIVDICYIGKNHVYDISLEEEHLFSCNGIYVSNSRKGALMMSLDVWHKEADTFITIKSNMDKINKANLSVEIDNEFMEVVEASIRDNKDYVVTRTSDFGDYDVCPIKLFRLICDSAKKSAEPGVIFVDDFRNYNIMQYCNDYKIETCNPCVTGDTLILTRAGYKRIDSLVDKTVDIWNGYEWSNVSPRITGCNQKLYQVTTSDGVILKCTPYHKFILKNGDRAQANELHIGDKLVKCNFPLIGESVKFVEDKSMYTKGFFSRDEHIKTNNKTFVPEGYSINSKLSWLAGIIDSDGTLNSKDGSIFISGVDRNFLFNIKLLLNTLGCNCVVSLNKESETKEIKGSVVECKDLYRLTISATNVKHLMRLGLTTHRVELIADPNRDASRFISIVDVKPLAELADKVYCFTDYKNNSGIFNGIITAQCGEQPLPKHGACNLSSINLSEYVIDPYTNNARIDYSLLSKDISIIVEAMDDVLEENLDRHALPEQRAMAENYRNIGIGIMGLADMFVKLKLVYGEPESIAMAEYLMKFIFRESVMSSVNIGIKKGSFPKYSNKVWDSDIINNAFNEDEVNHFREIDCLRNCSLLSIAPTGSIGTMLNISTGVEPFFALSYVRKTESLNKEGDTYYDVYIGEAKSYMDRFETNILPEYFVSSKDIDWHSRVLMQASLQKYTDTAISSTINLPSKTTSDDIMNIYIESWKAGLKGVTVYVDGSRAPILSEKAPVANTDRQAPERPKTLESDYYQVKVKGEMFMVIVGLLDGKPYEIFTFRLPKGTTIPNHKGYIHKVSKMHYSYSSDYISIDNLNTTDITVEEMAATLYSSMLLRHGVDINYIIKTAKKVNNNISSFSSAMCRILSKYIAKSEVKGEKCPECGGVIIKEGGCDHCSDCGWSKCG